MATSFFEKLKKGMGVEAPVKEEIGEELEEKPKMVQKEKKPQKNIEGPVPRAKKKLERKPEEKLLELPRAEGPEKKEIEVKKPSTVKTPEGKSSFVKTMEDKEKWLQPEGELAVDVYQTEEEIIIQSTIAGILPENLDISVENDVVTIRGIRERPQEPGERDYFYQECYWGPFSREIILPEETDPSRTAATMKEGILTIRIPKIQKQKKRRIVVQA